MFPIRLRDPARAHASISAVPGRSAARRRRRARRRRARRRAQARAESSIKYSLESSSSSLDIRALAIVPLVQKKSVHRRPSATVSPRSIWAQACTRRRGARAQVRQHPRNAAHLWPRVPLQRRQPSRARPLRRVQQRRQAPAT